VNERGAPLLSSEARRALKQMNIDELFEHQHTALTPWQWKSNGGFRAIGVLPNHPKFDHFSIESHDFLEIHHFKKPPFGSQ
jgi:hypothetical protein